MKVVITGSRDYPNPRRLFDYLNKFHEKFGITLLIHGGARGADRQSLSWAITRGIKWIEYAADWQTYGKAAGGQRNQQMINQKPDAVIAFFTDPQNPSPGTSDCVARAKKAAIPVYFGHENLE